MIAKRIEIILGIGVFLSLIARDAFFFGGERFIMVLGTFLALFYLIANWWSNKPGVVTARTIIVTILYGIGFSSLTFALIFQLLYLIGSNEMVILGFSVIAGIIILDLLLAIGKEKVINAWAYRRLAILGTTVLILFLIPQDYRISITFRNNPRFLECYEANKQKVDFDYIQRIYFHHYYEPGITLINCPEVNNKN